MKKIAIPIVTVLMIGACNPSPKNETAENTASGSQPEQGYLLTEVWRTDTLLKTCESVLFDKERNTLFVSCINGTPSDKNGTGYIARLTPDGSIETLEWVTGLNAPKGMGVYGNRLYVTDIDQLVIVDINQGSVIDRIPLEGASFLNDIDVDSDGTVYISDSDTGILWIYENGELRQWITEGLDRPNGLFVEESRVLLTSSGSEDLKIIDKSSGSYESVTSGIGAGDGLEFTGMDGYYIATSWAGEVFLIHPDFSKETLLKTSDQEINSADIGFNISEQMLYVPTFFDNRVVAYRLEKK
jgi:sugar lactone lactonase YvrE